MIARRSFITSLFATLLTGGCKGMSAPLKTREVRVTYYWPGDCGQVGTITATGKKARHLETCAVDPKVFPYGTHIHIPDMDKTLVANDTGSWVKKRIAAKKMGKDVPVVDVFVKSKREAQKMIKKHPHFMKVATLK